MKVILRKNFEALGQIGDVVDVKRGYALNYLIPRKIVYSAQAGNLKALEEEKKSVARKSEQQNLYLLNLKKFRLQYRCR